MSAPIRPTHDLFGDRYRLGVAVHTRGYSHRHHGSGRGLRARAVFCKRESESVEPPTSGMWNGIGRSKTRSGHANVGMARFPSKSHSPFVGLNYGSARTNLTPGQMDGSPTTAGPSGGYRSLSIEMIQQWQRLLPRHPPTNSVYSACIGEMRAIR